MSSNENLENLKRLSEMAIELSGQLQENISIFERQLEEKIKSAPEKDKNKLEDVRALTSQAISLAKTGRVKEAENLIKQFQQRFQNERQSNKP